jgi:hypothetical protein
MRVDGAGSMGGFRGGLRRPRDRVGMAVGVGVI